MRPLSPPAPPVRPDRPARLARLGRLPELPGWAGVLLTLADATQRPLLSLGVWILAAGVSVTRLLVRHLEARTDLSGDCPETHREAPDFDRILPGERDSSRR